MPTPWHFYYDAGTRYPADVPQMGPYTGSNPKYQSNAGPSRADKLAWYSAARKNDENAWYAAAAENDRKAAAAAAGSGIGSGGGVAGVAPPMSNYDQMGQQAIDRVRQVYGNAGQGINDAMSRYDQYAGQVRQQQDAQIAQRLAAMRAVNAASNADTQGGANNPAAVTGQSWEQQMLNGQQASNTWSDQMAQMQHALAADRQAGVGQSQAAFQSGILGNVANAKLQAAQAMAAAAAKGGGGGGGGGRAPKPKVPTLTDIASARRLLIQSNANGWNQRAANKYLATAARTARAGAPQTAVQQLRNRNANYANALLAQYPSGKNPRANAITQGYLDAGRAYEPSQEEVMTLLANLGYSV